MCKIVREQPVLVATEDLPDYEATRMRVSVGNGDIGKPRLIVKTLDGFDELLMNAQCFLSNFVKRPAAPPLDFLCVNSSVGGNDRGSDASADCSQGSERCSHEARWPMRSLTDQSPPPSVPLASIWESLNPSISSSRRARASRMIPIAASRDGVSTSTCNSQAVTALGRPNDSWRSGAMVLSPKAKEPSSPAAAS